MSKLLLRIFDGSRQLFSHPLSFLVTITDGTQTQRVRDYYQQSQIEFDLPFFDNFGDNYVVNVWAEGFKQAGFVPVILSNSYDRILDIMLVSESPGFNFASAKWAAVKSLYPFLSSGVDNAAASSRYSELMEAEKPLACLLNILEAMSQINLSHGTPLDYLKALRWDEPFKPAQDRFFAWCDRRMIDEVKIAAAAKLFAVELNPGRFHPGATKSWKQIQFGEANVQLTFHEGEEATIDGVSCVMVEPDIDYFKDLGAHALFEVIPNALTHSLTNPVEVYVLRWIAGRRAGIPEFNPRYIITS